MIVFASVPLAHRVEWANSPRVYGAEFSSDGSTVYVHVQTLMLDTLAAFVGLAWPIGVGVFVIGIALGLWWLARVNGRPQRGGLAYCRRCNYELTGQVERGVDGRGWAACSESARCTECGAALERVRPRTAIATWKRRMWPCGLMVIALGVLVLTGGMRLVGVQRMGLGDAEFFLSESLADEVEKRNIGWLRGYISGYYRLLALDPDSGEVLRQVLVSRTSHWLPRLTPDGATLVRLIHTQPDRSVLMLDPVLPGGRRARIEVPLRYQDFSRDSSPLVAVLDHGQRMLLCGYQGDDDVLLEVDVDSGATSVLHRSKSYQVQRHAVWSADRLSDPSVLVRSSSSAEALAERAVGVAAFDWDGQSLTERGSWSLPTGFFSMDLVLPGEPPVVLPGGKEALFHTMDHVVVMQRMTLSGSGEKQPVFGRSNAPYSLGTSLGGIDALGNANLVAKNKDHAIEVYHLGLEWWVREAQYPSGLMVMRHTLSRDGKRLAATAVDPSVQGRTGGGGGAGGAGNTAPSQGMLLLWDLGDPVDTKPRERRSR